MNIIIDKAASRGYADHGWLKTYHTFSFADYCNPDRMGFGALRVLNDDTLLPGEGFGMHPHRNMEVISIPLRGKLRHGDSLQNSHVISWGQIQVMSAGHGIRHSEYNDSGEEELKFLQIWVVPEQTDTPPAYADYDIGSQLTENEITTFLSPGSPVSIRQKAWFSWAILSSGTRRSYKLKGKRTGVYLFIVEGEIRIGETTLSRRDGAGITDTEEIGITASAESLVLLIEIPM